MILQALTEYYQSLAQAGKIAAPGWGPVKVSFALYLAPDGTLEGVSSTQVEQAKGKKTVLAPRSMSLPAPVKRSSGIAANFLCDNSGYLLGVDSKGKPQRALEYFAACRALHEKILDGVDTPAANALLAFFRSWEPKRVLEHPALAENLDEILSGANLVFRTDGGFVHEDPAVRQAWETYYHSAGDGPQGVCLVTGEAGPIESIHPSIKNVAGAQSSGAALVSLQCPGLLFLRQGAESQRPTGKFASFSLYCRLSLSNRIRCTGLRSFSLFYFSSPIRIV